MFMYHHENACFSAISNASERLKMCVQCCLRNVNLNIPCETSIFAPLHTALRIDEGNMFKT